ncbi:hypothetical protein [Kosakonia oryzendophytica]|uniref:hypothetical protein n=1 Tax=Kosakonia TaxID=1330547 RepID=UPI000776ECB7|nr:hypothetical protein [Kosakonia oryzendophytica]AMO46711.1 Hypothetical protein AKI40_0283 [Enterobacter sp. FY-07]WBT58484.1 hypothetical protein O9K67_01400 [Kosakonia oryzendophytica]
MISPALTELDNRLSANGFFDFLASLDADAALDLRDEAAFDEAWMQAYRELQAQAFPAQVLTFIDTLREKAFKHAFRINGNAEIAARIADDVDLIAKSLAAGKAGGWAVTQLWSAYLRGRFPATQEEG